MTKRAAGSKLPPLTESAVERTITDFLRSFRWEVVPTKAEHLTRGGHAAHRRGTLDLIALRAAKYGFAGCFFLELKRQGARSKRRHLAEQIAEQERLHRAGFQVCRIPEQCGDPIGWFKEWYSERGVLDL